MAPTDDGEAWSVEGGLSVFNRHVRSQLLSPLISYIYTTLFDKISANNHYIKLCITCRTLTLHCITYWFWNRPVLIRGKFMRRLCLCSTLLSFPIPLLFSFRTRFLHPHICPSPLPILSSCGVMVLRALAQRGFRRGMDGVNMGWTVDGNRAENVNFKFSCSYMDVWYNAMWEMLNCFIELRERWLNY